MNQELLQGLFTPSNNQQHSQAIESLESLRDSPVAWRGCSHILATSGISLDDKSKFVCLQILEHYTKTLYASSTPEDQLYFRQNISIWMSTICQCSTPEKVFIRNKTAQLLSLVFLVDYVNKWPTFIEDLLALQDQGPNAIDIYLKILLAIDAEIVDRDVLHSQKEAERNTVIKDTMRERSVVNMANSWHNILVKYEKSNPELVCHCHDVIGAYISWIDIYIIANDRFVCVLVKHLNDVLLRESAADCINEILLKGMEPLPKTHLIESFYGVLDQAGVLKPVEDNDSDFLVKLSKLACSIGVQLISSWNKLDKKHSDRENIRQAVENKVHLLLFFMASDYDDVSSLTFDFSREYIQMIKQTGKLTEVVRAQLENMLFVVITKLKYDESYNFDCEGEEEAMFNDYRKNLKIVFDNIASLVPDLVLKVCKDYITTTLNRWQSSSYVDVEAAIALLYNLGEAIPSGANHINSPGQGKVSATNEMMRLLVTSGVCNHEHPAVALQFFECVLRYEKFFSSESHFIPALLAAFLDQRGMRNKSVKVRSRTTYLFLRFVKCQKSHLVKFTKEILERIEDLLILCPIEEGQGAPLLSNDDQLYVYEASAILIICSDSPLVEKEMMMRKLLTHVLSKVSLLMHRLTTEPLPVKQLAISTSICHAISVTARTSKAFSTQNTMKSCNCVPLFMEVLQTFITCLNIGIEREVIGSGLRQLMHRMVVCLELEDLVSILPAASEALLFTPSMDALLEYLPLINQIIIKFKKGVSEFVRNIFGPLVSAIFTKLLLELEPNEEDEIRNQKSLQKSYFLFLNIIISNGLSDVIASQEPTFIQQVLHSAAHGAVESDDPSAQKNCFVFLKQLTEIWGGKDLGPPQYIEFIYSQVIPACFMAPLKSNFDLNDAQSLLALQESAMCLKTIYDNRGDEMINFLRSDFLPKKNLPPDISEEFCQALASDAKLFRNYSKFFFQRVKL